MGRLKKISTYTPSIFQGKLDFSAARRGVSVAVEHPFENLILRTLMIALLALCFAYLYFVGASVMNIIARKEMSAEATRLQSAIASIEQEYFALANDIDESVAVSYGLAPVENTQYIYRPGNAAAATIAGNGI